MELSKDLEIEKNMIPYRFDFALSNVEKGETILDVGTGSGLMVWYANSKGFNIEGMDINKEKVERAKLNFVGMKYYHDLPDGLYDCVIATEVLEHVPNPVDFLLELKKRAKKKIILTTPIGYNFDCAEHIHHWMSFEELIPVINQVSGSSKIEKIYKDGKTEFKTLFGVVIYV